MFFIVESDCRPENWACVSYANHWLRWLGRNVPGNLDARVRDRLKSNLKHILVGLELKKALILPHVERAEGQREVLFEPYFQMLTFEFCVGAFSVLEGLGSAHWLSQRGLDGRNNARIHRNVWRPVLCEIYDENGEADLDAAVLQTSDIRDRMHQDQIGARVRIDWHAMGYEPAFVPAQHAIGTLLRREAEAVPDSSNLPIGHV